MLRDKDPLLWSRKYIQIVWIRTSASGKTDVYNVNNKDSGNLLGGIAYYPQWRKYVFFPYQNTIFDADCLNEIAEVCQAYTEKHKVK